MTLHHKKHHQTYVNALNAATQTYEKASSAKERVGLQAALKFNGGGQYLVHLAPDHHRHLIGLHLVANLSLIPFRYCTAGHINHSLFWKNLAQSSSHGGTGGTLQDGPLSQAIAKDFGSLDALKKEFNTTTAAIQGSGWGWLVSLAQS